MARFRMRRAGPRRSDSGYMLLFLMLAVTVLTITMLGVARNYRRSIIRDREVEMMHRGDQYARAVKRYYKKNGSYPTSIEQLEKTNNIRYLRKRYKDPMSPDGSWKLVHLTDIIQPAATGLTPSTAIAAATPTGPGTGSSVFGQSSFGSSSSGTTDTSATGSANPGTTTAGTSTATTSSTASNNNPATGGQVLGGGPIIGVVSKMKNEGIHSFGDKTKYDEWFFVYIPTQDKGQLLVGPYNPKMFLGATAGTGLSTSGSSPATGSGTAAAPSGFSLSNQPSAPAPVTPAPSSPAQ